MAKLNEQAFILIDAFFKAERLDFEGRRNEELIKTQQEIIKFITEEWDGNYLQIDSLHNMGNISRSLVLDTYHKDHNLKKNGFITLCTCGRAWSCCANDNGEHVVLHELSCSKNELLDSLEDEEGNVVVRQEDSIIAQALENLHGRDER